MEKRRTRSLSLNLPELKDCPACKGKGTLKPMFYEMVCDACHGSGQVNAETGEPVPVEELIPAMRQVIAHLKYLNSIKGAELKRLQEQVGYSPYGDDLSKRHGGVYRGD